MQRPIDEILRDWRAAEASIPTDGSAPEVALLERIEFLRAEHAAAIAALDDEADELGRAPGQPARASEAAAL